MRGWHTCVMRCAKYSLCPTISLASFISQHAKATHPNRLLIKAGGRVALISNSHNIFHNLAAEEALLRGVVLQPTQQLLFMYVNHPCVVIGRNQNLLQEVALGAAQRDGVAVARRYSGGGAVYHDSGNVCFSFFTHRDAYNPAKTIHLVRLFLCHKYGIQPDCLTTTSRHDLFLDGMKITGSAMRVQRDIAYHHCTLLVSSCRRHLGLYLHAEGQYVSFSTTAIGSVRSSVTTLQSSGVLAPWQQLSSSSSSQSRNDDVMYDTQQAAAEFFIRHANEVMAHPEPWKLKLPNLSVDGTVEASRRSPTQVHGNGTFMLDVTGAVLQDTQIVDGEGRKPAAGLPRTLQQECRRLRSVEWLFAMPKFETRVVVTAEDLMAWKDEAGCSDCLPPNLVVYALQGYTELEITTVVESRCVVLLTSRWKDGEKCIEEPPWCSCLLKLLVEGAKVDDVALDLTEGNKVLKAAICLECRDVLDGLPLILPSCCSPAPSANDRDEQYVLRLFLQAVLSVWRAKNVFIPIHNINMD